MDNPISTEVLASWLAFDKPVTLEQFERNTGEMKGWGKLIGCWEYSSKRQTLSSYRIALYEGGTLWGDHRAEMEQRLAEGIEKLKALDPTRHEPDMAIHTRPNGRKVFFMLGGFGPGGASYLAYTTLSPYKYDLLVMRNVDFEDDMPNDQRLKDPAKPQKGLTDIFESIENEILKMISQQAGAAYPPQGVGSADP